MNRPEYFPKWMGPMPRVSAPWSDEEEVELIRGYRSGLTVEELEAKHGRGTGGINSRLVKLIPDYAQMQNYKQESDEVAERITIFTKRANEMQEEARELNRRLTYLSQQFDKYRK